MKFNLFGKKHKCNKCGMKFKDEAELMDPQPQGTCGLNWFPLQI